MPYSISSFAKDHLSHSIPAASIIKQEIKSRRGSESSTREESPPSMSHSDGSETAHTPRDHTNCNHNMKKKKEKKEEYEYKRNLPKHRKNVVSAVATTSIERENANSRDTRDITQRFAQISCHGDNSHSNGYPDDINEFDNDRKEDPAATMTRSQSMEGNETYDPYIYADSERRDSVVSQEKEEQRRMSDAGSTASQHSNGPAEEAHHALNGSTSDKYQSTT